MMTKRNITKIVLSVAGGLIIGSLGTIIIISQTQHVLTEEEYKEYNTLNDKKNLIEAYSIFYQSTGDLLRYITYNMLTENDIKRLSLTEECQTWMNANTLVETMKKSKGARFSITTTGESNTSEGE
jgi:hypothetical protein|nr:hypothetical protein [uncultured Prevotella sp.]